MIKTQKRHRFIVIEGIDGAGKTTVAKALADRLNGVYLRTPSALLEEFALVDSDDKVVKLRYYVDSFARSSPRTRFAFYLFSVAEATHYIKQILAEHDVVCDRFIASTLVYHRILDPQLANLDVSWAVELSPDYQFLLDVSDEEHVARLQGRGKLSDKLLEQDLSFLRTVRQEFKRFGLYTIDTSKRTVESVVDEIFQHIQTTENNSLHQGVD